MLERTLVRVLVFKHEGYRHEHEVQQEHGEPETLIHPPAETGDRHDDEEQHHEEDGDGADHPMTVHLHRLAVDDAVEQPGHGQSATKQYTPQTTATERRYCIGLRVEFKE